MKIRKENLNCGNAECFYEGQVSKMEFWDLYDGKRKPINRSIKRGEQKRAGEFHIVVEVWTINSKSEILVTLRDPKKDCYPNKWENTGGSLLSGETSRQGAVRELFEETGILALESELILLGTRKEQSIFIDIFLLRHDIEIENITLQTGETIDAKWVTLGRLDEIIEDGSLAQPTGERLQFVREEFKKHYSS